MFKRSGKRADLHLHSNLSDGRLSPVELMGACAAKGLAAVALTDHDTVEGLESAAEAAHGLGLRFVPGCELSVEFQGQDLHLLSYFIDTEAGRLRDELRLMVRRRLDRVEKILARLGELGIRLTMEQVLHEARDASTVGRPHIARAMVASGGVGSYQEAFARYLGDGAAGFVGKVTSSLEEAVEMVHEASGCVVLAHPGIYELEEVVPALRKLGVAGLEVYHPAHSEEQVRSLAELVAAMGWVGTGGSDFHGDDVGDNPIGTPSVSYEVVEELERRSRR